MEMEMLLKIHREALDSQILSKLSMHRYFRLRSAQEIFYGVGEYVVQTGLLGR